MSIKISILIPVYGVEAFIERCAISLFEQTYDDIEYVFVNDCTKDKSIEILQNVISRYPSRQTQVKIINHEKNRGLAAARNTGLDNCRGDYLMHVDSDDYIEKCCVESLIGAIESENKVDMLFFGSCSEWGSREIFFKSRYDGDKNALIKRILIQGKSASIWGILFRTMFYKKSGIRSIEGLNYSEDRVVVPRLIAKANVLKGIDFPLYHYQMSNAESYTNVIKPIYLENSLLTDNILSVFFTNEYPILDDKSLALMKLNTKLNFIKMVSKSSSFELYSKLQTTYREYNAYSKMLPKSDRVILFLFNNKLYSLLNFGLRFGRFLKYKK